MKYNLVVNHSKCYDGLAKLFHHSRVLPNGTFNKPIKIVFVMQMF